MSEILWYLNSDKVVNLLREEKRLDGRKVDELREIKIQQKVSESADGSARVQLGKTDVICGIKMELDVPYPDSPDEGSISTGIELLPLSSPEYSSGPPNIESVEISRVIDRAIREGNCLDFKSLCFKEGEKVWIAFLDLYSLNHDGNLFDAGCIAAVSALLNTKIPKVEDDKIVRKEYTNEKLKINKIPILLSFAKIENKILLDPTLAEEKASNANFHVSVTEGDLLNAFQKSGTGSFKEQELETCTETAIKTSKQIRKMLK